MMMEKQSAIRKTALVRAPRTSMRTQPNVFRLDGRFAICTTPCRRPRRTR